MSQQYSLQKEEYPLDYGEVMSYLSHALQMKNVCSKLGHDRFGFVKEVLKRLKLRTPANNLTCISLLTNERLTNNQELWLQQMKEDMLSLQGGQCYWFGTFLYALLGQLGFDIHLVGGGDKAYDIMFDMHSALIVYNLTFVGSIHLLESSPTYPIFQVIPLNPGSKTLIPNFAQVKRKFINDGKGVLKYCHLLGQGEEPRSYLSEIIEEGGSLWEVMVTYRYMSSKTVSHFIDIIAFAQLAPGLGRYYHKNILVHGFSSNRWISVFNCNVKIADPQGVTLNSFKVSSLFKVKDVILKYFPQYPPSLIDKCIKHVQRSDLKLK